MNAHQYNPIDPTTNIPARELSAISGLAACAPVSGPEPPVTPGTPPPATRLGTPCSPAWDPSHIALVEELEANLGRRVCGARTLSGTPCSLQSDHKNGRCRFHGGFDLSGGQPGNRNAVVHGLYSRAIQLCGEQCPMWKTCPCAGPDVARLPGPDRPRCPFEVAAYNAALTDARAALAARAQAMDKAPRVPGMEVSGPVAGPAQAMERHAACDLAMMRVMVLRAASALAVKSMVDVTVITGEKYGMTSSRPGAYLQAFLRVSSELRRYARMYGVDGPAIVYDAIVREQDRRAAADTSLLPEDLGDLDPPETPIQQRATELVNEANYYATERREHAAKTAFARAQFLAPARAACALDPASGRFCPPLRKLFAPP